MSVQEDRAETLDVHVDVGRRDARVQRERFLLRGLDGSFGGPFEFQPNPADMELESGSWAG